MFAIRWLLFTTCYLWLAIWLFLSETCYYLQKLVSFARCCTSRNFFIHPVHYFFGGVGGLGGEVDIRIYSIALLHHYTNIFRNQTKIFVANPADQMIIIKNKNYLLNGLIVVFSLKQKILPKQNWLFSKSINFLSPDFFQEILSILIF